MAQASAKKADLIVTAPLVVVRTKSGADVQLRNGDVVGDDVTKESVDHLRDLGYVSDEN